MTAQHSTAQPDARHGLFRSQAVQKQQDRLLGDVLVIPPMPYAVITAVILIFVALGMSFLVNANYARKETVQGYLTPNLGLVKIYASTSGIVRQVFVKEGDTVISGQPLFVINGDTALEDGNSLEQSLLNEYETQKRLLSQQLQQLPSLQAHRLAEINQADIQLELDIQHLLAQQKITAEQFTLAQKQKRSVTNLHKQGAVSQTELDAATEKELALRAALQNVERELDASRAEKDTLELRRAALTFEEDTQRNELQRSLSALAQQIAQLNGQRAYVVKATQAGTVSNVQISEGQEATNSLPLATITPAGSQLIAELLVPTRAIGFVEPGQTVKIRYSAYSYQKFGLYNATIQTVSKAVLLPQELNNARINVQEPMYRVTATLQQDHVETYGKQLALKPGIALDADIKLADRTLLEWLLEPIYSLKGRV